MQEMGCVIMLGVWWDDFVFVLGLSKLCCISDIVDFRLALADRFLDNNNMKLS